MSSQAVTWFRQLRAISQYGLAYSKDPYDRERFRQVGAIASEIAAGPTEAAPDRVTAALALETGPPTPKLDVRAAVFRGDAILMVRETSDGGWALPGGWIDIGESPARAAEREVKEESGYECRATKLFAVVDRDRHPHPPMLLQVYKLFFLCDLVGGAPETSVETSDVAFFELRDLPPLSTTRILTTQIECAFRHRDQPHLPTEFD